MVGKRRYLAWAGGALSGAWLGGAFAGALLLGAHIAWAGGGDILSGPAPGTQVEGTDDILYETSPMIRGLMYYDAFDIDGPGGVPATGLTGTKILIFHGHCGSYQARFIFPGGAAPDLVVTQASDLDGLTVPLPDGLDENGAVTVPNVCDPDPTDGMATQPPYGYQYAVVDHVDQFELLAPNVFIADVTLRPLVVFKNK